MTEQNCMFGADDQRCGKPNGYTNLGCRGDACREAWAKYHFDHFGTEARETKLAAAGLFCEHPGCDRGMYAKVSGFCRKHHARFKRSGSSYGTYGPRGDADTVSDAQAMDQVLTAASDDSAAGGLCGPA